MYEIYIYVRYVSYLYIEPGMAMVAICSRLITWFNKPCMPCTSHYDLGAPQASGCTCRSSKYPRVSPAKEVSQPAQMSLPARLPELINFHQLAILRPRCGWVRPHQAFNLFRSCHRHNIQGHSRQILKQLRSQG